MNVLLYQQMIDDKKNNRKFAKDKVSYRGKTFDAVLTSFFKEKVKKALDSGLKYPLILDIDLDKGDYFTKLAHFTRNDGTNGSKIRIVLMDAQSISQGKFESKSLDDCCDDIEEEVARNKATNSEN